MRGLGLAEAGLLLLTGEGQGGLEPVGNGIIFPLVHTLQNLQAGANHAWSSSYSCLYWGQDLSWYPLNKLLISLANLLRLVST